MLQAIESGYVQTEIQKAAFDYQRAVETRSLRDLMARYRVPEYSVPVRARNSFDGNRARRLSARGAGADDVRRHLPAAAAADAAAKRFQTELKYRCA